MSTTESVLNDTGSLDIEWGFWDAQLEAIEALNSGAYDLVIYRGGYGSGKTVTGSRQIIESALNVPRSDNLILAQDTQKGGPTTFKGFFRELPGEDTIPDEGGTPENSPLITDYNINKGRLTLVNGSVIRLGSGAEWNRFAGGEFHFIWADEVAHYDADLHKLLEMLVSRQRTEEGPNVSLWTSTGNGYNDFHTIAAKQVDADGDPLATRIKNVVADSRDNPFLPEKEKIVRQFAGTAREGEALAGGFAAAQGLVYSHFSREHHLVTPERACDLVRGDWRMYGYDHGWDDPRVVVEYGRTAHDQYVALDLFYETETTVEEAIEWLDEYNKPKGIIHSEHEPEHVVKFQRAGWQARNAEKDLDVGIPIVRDRLRLDSEGRPGLLVSEDCTPLVQEFMSYKEKEVGTAKATDHALDASRYCIVGNGRLPDRQQPDHGGVRQF